LIWAALAIDWALGDPACCHPVRLMGLLIAGLENLVRPRWLEGEHFWVGWLAGALLLSCTVAARGLAAAGRTVFLLLARGDLPGARQAVGRLVARDTDRLAPAEVARAAVETVAENTVDGVTAPLFYAFIGGVPLAVAYRAVNTLDAMVGYRNERYRDFGWCAARLDDLANFLPARLTGCLLCLAAFLLGLRAKHAWRTMRRDARRHPSPNGGFPEAAVAGALGVRLGGVNYYGGVEERRPYLGEVVEPLAPQHILLAVRLMAVAGLLGAAAGSAGLWLASVAWGRAMGAG
jgi:adenosylcobinamide-phosphate synthase